MILCYVTDRHLLNRAVDKHETNEELLWQIEAVASAGVDWIQIREKDLTAHELVLLARRAIDEAGRSVLRPAKAKSKDIRTAAAAGARIIVNDRLDVALAAGAAGVHLGSASIPAAQVVTWLRSGNAPADFMVGVSCHQVEEAVTAERAGASYIFFGPIYETASKKTFGPPQGLGKLAGVCRSIQIPVLAIGGITEGNAPACVHAGASGVAAIRMFQDARDSSSLAARVSRLRSFAAQQGC